MEKNDHNPLKHVCCQTFEAIAACTQACYHLREIISHQSYLMGWYIFITQDQMSSVLFFIF